MPISAVNLRWLTEPHDLHRIFASEEKSLVVSPEGEDFTYTPRLHSVNITIEFQILSNPESSLTAARRMGLCRDRPALDMSSYPNVEFCLAIRLRPHFDGICQTESGQRKPDA
jgi:hypothetical protein